MVKSTINEIHETIKVMLSYALGLAESQVVPVYQLAHYLADNILTKVCLAVAIEHEEEQQTYTSSGWTKNLYISYKDHLKKYYPQVPDYDPFIKNYHDERNIYQHDVKSFDTTMTPPRAKSYVELVEQIMRTVGVRKSSEIIQPICLFSPFGIYDYTKHQTKTKEIKYQQLYDLFKKKYDEDIYIEFEHAINTIFYSDLNKTLKMEGGKSHGMLYFHNSGWDIQISRHGVNLHSSKKQQGYSMDEPNNNVEILEDFLKYYRECCDKTGMRINP